MKNPKIYKRIMGLIVIIMTIALVPYSVKAVELDCTQVNCCAADETMAPFDVISRYGLSVEPVDPNNSNNHSYRVKMNPQTNRAQRCQVHFTITQINDRNVEQTQRVTCDTPAIVNTGGGTTRDPDTGLTATTVTLLSDAYVVKNENARTPCYYKELVWATVGYAMHIPRTTSEVHHDTSVLDQPNIIPRIDCNNPSGAFQENFCRVRLLAEQDSANVYTGREPKITGDDELKCESNVENVPISPSSLEGDDYFVNHKYFYKIETTFDQIMGYYTYRFSPDRTTQGEAVQCTINCEEAVEVEYGPPVASKAGMCFEYNVRVTSRTSCYMENIPDPPPEISRVGEVAPYCPGYGRSADGGPSELFDQCIQKCDGGKYTTKCSKQCYKQSYGDTSNKVSNTSDMIQYGEKLANNQSSTSSNDSLAECFAANPSGCYVTDGTNIYWKVGPQPAGIDCGGDENYPASMYYGEGRWYTEHPGGAFHQCEHVVGGGDGFWRKKYGTNLFCNATCYWEGSLDGAVYLNPGMSEADYGDGKTGNSELYNSAIAACQAKATCSTATTTFKISADYIKDDPANPTTINFDTESITNNGNTLVSPLDGTARHTMLNPEDGGVDGCYGNAGPDEGELYKATWGFPGTWINLKTGEISFTEDSKTSSTAWTYHNRRLCIPHDAKAVNSEWWNKFYRKVMNQTPSAEYQVNSTEIKDRCMSINEQNTILTATPTGTQSNLVYNIHAQTRHFGFFEWDIDIACFFALNPKPTVPTTSTSSSSTREEISCTPSVDNYEIRTVNLEDMFPSTEGSVLSDPSQAGRTPGFNWSSAADGSQKNASYLLNPQTYLAYVQGKGNSIYDENHLDYEFNLSPQQLREIRKENSGGGGSGQNYTNFVNSDFKVDDSTNGVNRYKSDFIAKYATKRPTNYALNCNNMVNYKVTDRCETDFKD